MYINQLEKDPGPDLYYTDGLRQMFEDHLTYLKTHPKTTSAAVNSFDAYKYEGDFYGLLEKMKIAKHFHWIIMRVNDMTNMNQSKSTLSTILVPDFELMERLKNVYRTKKK